MIEAARPSTSLKAHSVASEDKQSISDATRTWSRGKMRDSSATANPGRPAQESSPIKITPTLAGEKGDKSTFIRPW